MKAEPRMSIKQYRRIQKPEDFSDANSIHPPMAAGSLTRAFGTFAVQNSGGWCKQGRARHVD